MADTIQQIKISRRTFLKGLAVLSVAAYAPALLASPDVTVEPLPAEAATHLYLDNIAALYAICRKPGEPDEALRRRVLAKYHSHHGRAAV